MKVDKIDMVRYRVLMFRKLCHSTFIVLSIFLSTTIIASSSNPYESLIAAVVVIEEADEPIEVWINTREEWLTRGALIDNYDDKNRVLVEQITEKLNLCNLAESSYSPCRSNRSVEELSKQLKDAGVEIPEDFQSWAQSEAIR